MRRQVCRVPVTTPTNLEQNMCRGPGISDFQLATADRGINIDHVERSVFGDVVRLRICPWFGFTRSHSAQELVSVFSGRPR